MKNKWITFDAEERRIAWIAANVLRNKVLPLFTLGITDRKKVATAIREFEILAEMDYPHLEIAPEGTTSQACVVMRISQLADNLMSTIAKQKSGLHVSKHVEMDAIGARVKQAVDPIKSEIAILFGLASKGFFEYSSKEEVDEENKK